MTEGIHPKPNSASRPIRSMIAFATLGSQSRSIMTQRHYSMIVVFGLFSLGLLLFVLSRSTPAQGQYPLMDDVANKIVQKYQTSTCEQLWVKKSAHAPPTMEETRIVTFLHDDADMRMAFMKIVAPPVVNKMFDCGLIP
jgi:hypothetical protein